MNEHDCELAAADLGRLSEILDERGILTGADARSYEQGARYDAGKALFVARPRNTREVSEVVAHCVRSGIRMVAQSGNTGLVGGSTPDMSGAQAVISLERLNDGFELSVPDRTVRVGAGMRLSALNQKLESDRLFFPIDLGADPMIGGMVSTNTGGARFLRYGDVRANVLGLEIVLADEKGTVLDLLHNPRKNNTGLDLKQVFIGTGGRFGIVTRAELLVHYLPKQRATALLIPRDDMAATELLLEFERRAGPCLAAFEGMSANAIELAVRHVPNLRNPFAGRPTPDLSILVEIARDWPHRDGEDTIDEMLLSVLEEIWELENTPLADALVVGPEEAWAVRHALSHGLADSGRVNGFDLGFSREAAMRFRARATAATLERFPQLLVCDFGHIGDGGTHFNIVEPKQSKPLSEDERHELKELVYDIAVREFGGSFSAEHGIGRSNQLWYEKYVPEGTRAISERIRQALGSPLLDPLSPSLG